MIQYRLIQLNTKLVLHRFQLPLNLIINIIKEVFISFISLHFLFFKHFFKIIKLSLRDKIGVEVSIKPKLKTFKGHFVNFFGQLFVEVADYFVKLLQFKLKIYQLPIKSWKLWYTLHVKIL